MQPLFSSLHRSHGSDFDGSVIGADADVGTNIEVVADGEAEANVEADTEAEAEAVTAEGALLNGEEDQKIAQRTYCRPSLDRRNCSRA
jgi:hypothetical protein